MEITYTSNRLTATVKQGRDANARVIETFSKMPTSLKSDLEKVGSIADSERKKERKSHR